MSKNFINLLIEGLVRMIERNDRTIFAFLLMRQGLDPSEISSRLDEISTGLSTKVIEKIQNLDDENLLFSYFLLDQNSAKQRELKKDIRFFIKERGFDFIDEIEVK